MFHCTFFGNSLLLQLYFYFIFAERHNPFCAHLSCRDTVALRCVVLRCSTSAAQPLVWKRHLWNGNVDGSDCFRCVLRFFFQSVFCTLRIKFVKGLVLLRMVDPESKTPVPADFAYKQLLFSPFMGGGNLEMVPLFPLAFTVFVQACGQRLRSHWFTLSGIGGHCW